MCTEQWFNAKVAAVAKLQGVSRAKQEKLANQRRDIYADISKMKDQVSRDYAQIQQQDNDDVIGESARALGDRQPSPSHDPNFHHPNFTLVLRVLIKTVSLIASSSPNSNSFITSLK